MDAETLNCPMCGAPQATDATRCDHCGARLATVACPSCFGLVFEGSKFCSHCGAKIEQPKPVAQAKLDCPHCKIPLDALTLGASNLLECSKCEGIWLDTATFEQICADREKQTAVLGLPGPVNAPPGAAADYEDIRYYPCPVCKGLMNRIQFAHCSHVIVDVCTQHGTWFDKDELRKIIEFIRAGGFDKARQREIDDLTEQRSFAQIDRVNTGNANLAPIVDFPTSPTPQRYDGYDLAIGAAGVALKVLFSFIK